MGASSNISQDTGYLMSASYGASAITSMGTAVNQATAAKTAADYARRTAEMNQKSAMVQADDAIRRGRRAAGEIRRQGAQAVSAARADAAGQGVIVDAGSSAALQADIEANVAVDALTIENNAYREAMGYKAQALDFEYRGKFANMGGRYESRNTLITGGLRSVGQAGMSYYYAKNPEALLRSKT